MDALPDSNKLLTDTVISPDDYGIPPSLLPPYIGGPRPKLGPDYVKNDYVIAVTRRSDTTSYWYLSESNLDDRDYKAFWADCYLVCEQALKRGFDKDRVILLYDVGVDFIEQGDRYRTEDLPPYINDPNPNLTRYYGSYEALDSLMNWLSTGNPSEGIRAMDSTDFLLFFATYHGYAETDTTDTTQHYSFFNLHKNNNDTAHVAHVYDTTLARWANNINSWRQVFVITSCHSGGFAPQLEAPGRVAYTSADIEHNSHVACVDSCEDSNGKVLRFGHGDLTFPFFNAIRREKIFPYNNPPLVDANLDNLQGISFEEAWKYQLDNNPFKDTWWYSFPQHRDPDSIAHNTYFLAAPLLPPDRVRNLRMNYEEGYVSDTFVDYSDELDNILYWHSLELFWDPDTTEDIYYYRIYKNGTFLTWTYGTYYYTEDVSEGDYFYVKAVDIYNDIGFPSDTVYVTSTGDGGQSGSYVLKDIDIELSTIINRKASIKLILPENKNIEILLYNSAGRRIKTLYKGETAKGIHTLTLDTGKLSKGAYFVVLRTNNKNITRKIVIE